MGCLLCYKPNLAVALIMAKDYSWRVHRSAVPISTARQHGPRRGARVPRMPYKVFSLRKTPNADHSPARKDGERQWPPKESGMN